MQPYVVRSAGVACRGVDRRRLQGNHHGVSHQTGVANTVSHMWRDAGLPALCPWALCRGFSYEYQCVLPYSFIYSVPCGWHYRAGYGQEHPNKDAETGRKGHETMEFHSAFRHLRDSCRGTEPLSSLHDRHAVTMTFPSPKSNKQTNNETSNNNFPYCLFIGTLWL